MEILHIIDVVAPLRESTTLSLFVKLFTLSTAVDTFGQNDVFHFGVGGAIFHIYLRSADAGVVRHGATLGVDYTSISPRNHGDPQ